MTGEIALALLLAAAIGLLLGLMGSGGSIVTLPVLVYVAGIPTQTAVGMTMVIVGAVSFVGAYLYHRRGDFHARAVLLLGLTGIVGAYGGSALTRLVSPSALMLTFAALMLVVGLTMFRGRREAAAGQRCYPLRCLSVGAAVGVLTGFLGVGGGFLIVPALVLFAGLETKKAVGASLAIIGLNCAAGLAGQLRYTQFNWTLTLAFVGIALGGMWAGTAFAGRLDDHSLRRIFACFLVTVGLVIGGVNLL